MIDDRMREAVLESYEASVELMEAISGCETVEASVNCAMLRRLLEEHALLCGFVLGHRSIAHDAPHWWK